MFRKISVILILSLALASFASAVTWQLDNTHSAISFKIRHLVISNVAGTFGTFSGTLEWAGDEASLAEGTVSLTIDAKSINTNNEGRDEHLQNEDFFDVPKFPTIDFVSTKVLPGKDGQFQLQGNMTMKGITKEVTFDCTFNGQAEFRGGKKVGFTVTAEIDRTAFGMEGSGMMDGGGLILGNIVAVTMDLEFNEAKEADTE